MWNNNTVVTQNDTGHVETQTMQTADSADRADCADCADWVLFFFICTSIF